MLDAVTLDRDHLQDFRERTKGLSRGPVQDHMIPLLLICFQYRAARVVFEVSSVAFCGDLDPAFYLSGRGTLVSFFGIFSKQYENILR